VFSKIWAKTQDFLEQAKVKAKAVVNDLFDERMLAVNLNESFDHSVQTSVPLSVAIPALIISSTSKRFEAITVLPKKKHNRVNC